MNDLVIALERVDFLPPDRVTDDVSILTLKSLVLEPLCTWRDGVAGPGLLWRWDHDETGRLWTFHIRPGARFHDGVDCTADDILAFIATIRTARDMFGMKWSYARYFEATTFHALSRTTIQVSSPHPFADILDVFTDFFISRTDSEGRPILGTGPYRVTDFEPRRRAVLERVSAGSGPRRLVAQAEPNAETRLHKVRAGEVDVACNLERAEAPPDFAEDLHWGQAGSTLSVIAYLNAAEGLFQSAEARLAVNHAIDRGRIINEVFGGLAIPAATVVSPFHLGFQASNVAPIAYDPDLAKRLLERAAPSGELVLRTPLFMPEKALQVGQALRDDLADVGLSVRLEVETDRPEYARQIGRKAMGDMAIFDSSPHSTYRVLNDKISSAAQGVWWQGHDDPELERLIAAANAAVSFDARERDYGRCLARLNANPPWIYLYHPIDVFAARKSIVPPFIDHKGVLKFTS
jgi:peptide/nickel transport system substrate-binding protein